MSKTKIKAEPSKHNPFLTDKADLLWNSLDTHGKLIDKKEVLERIKNVKNKRTKE